MKKIIHNSLIALVLIGFSFNSFALETKNSTIIPKTEAQIEARLSEIKNRVEVIRNIDRSNLISSQKKELRTELRVIKNEARGISNSGIYFSVTALLVIIIILIIL
ncbi:MAG: hypothetical protein EAZ15_03155 [Sphingobacteriales bacterium]|nr:MAG: hypothetical protein EAZ15_03155 [Sphingobacteriales bacterium]